MTPRADHSPEMTRILSTLDEMAVLFLRLDQEIRAFAAAGADPAPNSPMSHEVNDA